MRSYKAARRAARRAEGAVEPVEFEVSWFETETQIADGEPVKVEVERTDVFRAYGEPSTATLTDAGYYADADSDSPEAMAIIRRVFMECIGDDAEFARFWKISRHLGDTLIDIMADLIEDTLGRPTNRSSDSSAPSSTDGQRSRAVSSPGAPSVPVEVQEAAQRAADQAGLALSPEEKARIHAAAQELLAQRESSGSLPASS